MAPFFRFGINYPEVIGNDIAAGWFDCVFVRRGPDRLIMGDIFGNLTGLKRNLAAVRLALA